MSDRLQASGQMRPTSLYIHIPFCIAKCPYCAFFSRVLEGRDPVRYIDALLGELQHTETDRLRTLYIGGGTPTCLDTALLEHLMAGIAVGTQRMPDTEFTIEANPGTLNPEKLATVRAGGVNRISIGCQTFEPELLRVLGRVHNGSDSYRAFDLAREAGFDNVSIDLMYGIPGQTTDALVRDITAVLAMGPEHVSWYELTLEPGTLLHDRYQSEAVNEDLRVTMTEMIGEQLEAAGYQRYEVSNYARPGAECRHNLVYWHCGDCAAAGAGAVSLVNGRRVKRYEDIDVYIRTAGTGIETAGTAETVDPLMRQRELIMMGLRLTEGIDNVRYKERTGEGLDRYAAVIRRLEHQGWLTYTDGWLRTTPAGSLLLNEILLAFF